MEFKSGTNTKVPIVIRAVVGKGWGQGPQHSKSLHSWFANLPGIELLYLLILMMQKDFCLRVFLMTFPR